MDAVVQKEETGSGKVRDREAIIERKLRLSENPSSIVIAPKTREGHTLVKILFAFDRAISRIRLRAGTYIKVQDAVVCLKQAEGFITRVNDFILSFGDGRGLFGSFYEDLETKKMLARRLSTYIILPRTNEGKEVAGLIKRLDPALLQFRNTCTDFGKSEDTFIKLIEIVRDFNVLVQELSSVAKISYDPPRDLETLLSVGIGEVVARKGKKSGGVA